MMKISLKRLTPTAQLPERGTSASAGYDLFADISEPVELAPHATTLIGTGIAVAIPEGYFGGVYARSGLSSKEGLRPANCTGVIDADYRGEIKVPVHNDSECSRTISPSQKIAQMIIQPFLSVEYDEVSQLDETARGLGGFGSTGR